MNLQARPMDAHACRVLALDMMPAKPRNELQELADLVLKTKEELRQAREELATTKAEASKALLAAEETVKVLRAANKDLATAAIKPDPVPAGPGLYDRASRTFTVSDSLFKELLDALAPYASTYQREVARDKAGRMMWQAADDERRYSLRGAKVKTERVIIDDPVADKPMTATMVREQVKRFDEYMLKAPAPTSYKEDATDLDEAPPRKRGRKMRIW